jgi:hypothetical protein
MDQALNIGFFILHTSWIAFNCLGWIWRRTRPWQLATIALTAASWFGLGLWYGWGYCPCTDWHWQARARLGFEDPPSYIQLLIREVAGIELGPATANALAVGGLALSGMLGVVLAVRDRQRGSAPAAIRPGRGR